MLDDLHRGLARRIHFWRRQARLLARAVEYHQDQAERAELEERMGQLQAQLVAISAEVRTIEQRVKEINAK